MSKFIYIALLGISVGMVDILDGNSARKEQSLLFDLFKAFE